MRAMELVINNLKSLNLTELPALICPALLNLSQLYVMDRFNDVEPEMF